MGRLNYSVIFNRYKRVGKGNVRLTQSALFLTKPIQPTQSTYQFDVLETQTGTLQPDEIRLNLNDEFIIASMGLYLVGTQKRSDGAAGSDAQVLFTYAPAELDGTTARNLANFYAGQLSISVNNIVYLEKWDSRRHLNVPRTQYANLVAAPGGQATIASNEFSKNGMFPVEPLITISGSKKTTIQLQLPTAITAGTFTHTDDKGAVNTIEINRVGLLLRGLNAQNGAVFQN